MKKNLMFIIVFSFLLTGCQEKNSTLILKLPDTHLSSDFNLWGVTKFGGLKLRQDPREDSEIINHLPYGALAEILVKQEQVSEFENIRDYWYYIDFKGQKGWIFGYYLFLYNTYDEAYKKSEELLFKNIEKGE